MTYVPYKNKKLKINLPLIYFFIFLLNIKALLNTKFKISLVTVVISLELILPIDNFSVSKYILPKSNNIDNNPKTVSYFLYSFFHRI